MGYHHDSVGLGGNAESPTPYSSPHLSEISARSCEFGDCRLPLQLERIWDAKRRQAPVVGVRLLALKLLLASRAISGICLAQMPRAREGEGMGRGAKRARRCHGVS